MAATIAKIIPENTRQRVVTRLGHQRSHVEAATWRTFARATVAKDGSGRVSVERSGKIIHEFEFGPENEL